MQRADVRHWAFALGLAGGIVGWSIVAGRGDAAVRRREAADFAKQVAERDASNRAMAWPSADDHGADYPDDVAPVGLVVREDGSPVDGALVRLVRAFRGSLTLEDAMPTGVRSGRDGRFPLDAARDLDFACLDVTAPGLVRVSPLASYRRGRETRVVMTKARPVRVRVIAAEGGAPVRDVRVRAYTGPYAVGAAYDDYWPAVDEAATDAAGRAVVACAGGDTAIRIEAEGFAPFVSGLFETPIEGADREAALSKGGRVEGTVHLPLGAVVAGATVLASSSFGYFRSTVTDRDGRFAFEDVPGADPTRGRGPVPRFTATRLVVRAAGFPDASRDVGTLAAGSVTRVDLVLESGRVVEGSIRRTDGSPAGGVEVQRVPATPWRVDALRPSRIAHSDSGGSFRLVSATGALPLVVADPSTGLERNVTVRVDPAGTPPRLDLVLDEPRVPFAVRVLDAEAKPCLGVTVVATRAGRRVTGADGRVVFPSAPRGRVTIRAERAGFAPRWKRIELAGDVAGDTTLRFGSGVLSGRAVHPDGTPASVTLEVDPPSGGDDGARVDGVGIAYVVTGIDGSFRVDGLGSGRCTLSGGEPALHVLVPFDYLSVEVGATDARVVVAYPHEEPALRPYVEIVDAATGAAMSALPGLEVSATTAPDPPDVRTLLAVPDSPGLWRFLDPIAPGVHRASASLFGYEDSEWQSFEVKANGPPPHVRFALRRTSWQPGHER